MAINARQQAFIDYYLIYRNASKAARLAGYNGKSNVIGPRLLADVSIHTEIEKRLKEKHLSANEVLARLSDMAYADIRNFATIESPADLLKPKYRGKTHVIRKFKKTVTITRKGDEITTTELELYDARQTLVDIGRHYSLFTDKFKVDDWRTELVDLFRQGKITKEDLLNEFADQPETAFEFFESFGLSPNEGRQTQVDSATQTNELAE